MKRKIFTILSIILISYSLSAQDSDKQKTIGKIGFSYSSFGENDVIRNKNLIGAASYNSDKFFTIGINYVKPINTWLELESGVEYSEHTILIRPAPGLNMIDYKSDFSLITIPITLRANFFRFFFINGGLFLDLDASEYSPIDSQTGIGSLIGIAAKYDFNFWGSIFINPYLKFHDLVPFLPEDNKQKIYESGIRIGLTYNLNRVK